MLKLTSDPLLILAPDNDDQDANFYRLIAQHKQLSARIHSLCNTIDGGNFPREDILTLLAQLRTLCVQMQDAGREMEEDHRLWKAGRTWPTFQMPSLN